MVGWLVGWLVGLMHIYIAWCFVLRRNEIVSGDIEGNVVSRALPIQVI